MIIHFKTLVSSNIKRKKPWSKVAWVGNLKESVCLFDKSRVSILYLPSGKTKKSISCLQPFKKEIVCFNTSSSGEYIVAVLTNGEIIRWEKDSNHVLRIESSPGVIVQTGKDSSKIHIYINSSGDKVLLVIGNKVNVWDRGRWVGVGLGQFGSSPLTKEVSIDARFFNNMDQGECCLCTFVFNTGNKMSMFCLFLRWLDHACNDVGFVSTVSTHTFPLQHIHPQCKPIRLRGSYITCISHDGQTVATAVNQRQPHQSKLMFIHPYTAASVVVDLKHLGSKSDNVLKQFAKTYWIAQMSWTSDDVYLACITRRGSLLLLSKLGQPIMIACEGSRVDFGPAHFLPLHPLVEHGRNKHDNPLSHNKDDESLASTVISEKSTRQKFSVSTHPRLPIILCSDGYSVTALQMSEWVRSRDLATISLVEINRDLKSISKKFNLEVTRHTTPRFEPPPLITETAKFKENKFTLLYESFVKRVSRKNKRNKSEENLLERSFSKNEEVEMLAYRFEEDENEATQDETDNDDDSRAPPGVILDADSGKLSFVDLDETEQTLDENLPLDGESLHKLISQCLLKLLSTWGIMTSESHHNTNHANDELHQFFLQTLRCICSTVLQAQQIASCLVWRIGSDEHGTSPVQRTLSELLDTIPKRLCIIASWDAHYRPVVVKSITTAIETILTSSRSSPEGCLSIKDLSRNIFVAFYSLKQCEKHLNLVYSFHLSPLRLVNNRHMTDCFFHSLDVEDFKPTNHSEVLSSQRLMLWQAWRKFYSFVSKIWDLEQCKQILPSLSRVYSTVQKIVLPRSCDRDIIERSTTLSSMRLNLCEYKLNQALRLVARILDDHLVTGSKWSDTNWASVELICKVMIDYYKDKPIVFQTNEYGGRMIVLDRGVLTSAVSSQRLSAHWSAEHAVSILLCAGRLYEASELAVAVGAWRVGVALSAVATKVRAFTDDYRQFDGSGCADAVIDILKDKFIMFLPESIKSEVVKNTEELFDFDPELLYPEVVDLFTVGVMTGSDLSSWVIDLLMNKLKTKLGKLDLLLNDDVHIPTPPMHLPQLNMGEDEDENLVLIRHQLSSLIRLLFVTFHSMGITHLAASWYVKLLRSGESPMSSLSEDKSENLFSSEEGRMVVASLREICGMLWSLHVREKLTEATRAYQRARENEEVLEAVVHDCYAWLSRAKVFAKFYNWDEEIQDLVLCLASELPVDEDLIHIIAEHFHDPNIISAKVDPKMKILMQRMRQTFYNVDGTLQPMTVLYQRLCSELDTQKHHNTQVQHMFMDKHESSHPDGEWYVPKFTESYKASLCAVFPFEKDQCFHEFISQLFDVVLNKASTIQRSGKMKKSEKNDRNILLLCNRHQVATNELDAAFKVRSRQKQFTKIENLSHNTPDATSTPKIRKSTSFNEKPTTKRRNITFQLPNHNNLHRYFSEPDLNGSILDETFDKSLQIPTFDKSKIPQWMKKRLLRLSPYLGWLELWINSQVPTSHTHQPSIRINLTKHQMLQGLTVAELRFGDFPKPISTKKQIFLPPLKIESCVTVLTDDDVTTVSSIASVDVNQNEDQTVNQVEPVNETEPVNQTESVNQSDAAISQTVVDQLISTDQSEPQVGQPIQSQGPMETETSEEVTVIEVKDKEENKKEEQEEEEEKGGKKDTTLVLDDLKDDENIEGSSVEDFSSELADGGGTYRVNNKNKKPNKDENVADVVRSEINNVLLAQQVSLLSQILLGQTLTGGSQRGGNPLVGNILQSLLPTAPPSVANEPKVEKQEVHEESHKKVHDHVYHMKPSQPKKDFGIPLFHVPGITKSHDPKSAKLISTPNSATSWRASLAAKKTYDAENSPQKPPKLINLKDRKKPLVIQDTNLQHPIRHTLPTNLPYETPIDPPNPTQPVLMKPPTPQHIPSSYTTQQPGPAAKQTYKTQYPILQINPQHPKAPSFNSAPQPAPIPRQESHHAPLHPYTQPPVLNPPREAWVEGKAPKPIFINCQSQQYPRQQTHRDLIPRLINPQEVLEYESRKHGFTNIKKSSGPTQPRVPLMKVSAPPFEHTGGHHKPQEPPQVTPPMINKENVNPAQVAPQTKPTQPAPPLHKATQPHEEFHGFIDQDEVRREVEMKMLGSDEKMTGADAHYVATVGKHEKPHKPRMKDADTQIEVEEQPHQR
nr:uncharacterized protein LOC100176591 isoform X1 [Ciona intestinalis]|eukprot:XP_026692817.1 uncharacterized protein LOC100176591 isoform X1 [Ciona intestinalis]